MMSQTVSSHSELRKNFAHKTNRDGDFTATNVPWDWNEMDNMEEKRRRRRRRRGFRVNTRATARLRRREQQRGPAADGRWRETLVTQQSTVTGRLLCAPGTPPLCESLCHQAGPGHSSQDSRLHGVSASPQENTRRAASHSPAAALDSHALPLGRLSSSSTPFLTALTGFHHTASYTYAFASMQCARGSQPPCSSETGQ